MSTGAERQAAYRARKIAEGYRIVHGRFTLEPRRPPGSWLRRPPPAHGTNARYHSRAFPCRCDLCRAAANEHGREWQRANPGKRAAIVARYEAKKRAR